jgi:ABC-type bacteriocin/lantibiotic exporter with double-glycine peptidase domain
MRNLLAFALIGTSMGCSYLGTARAFDPGEMETSAGWVRVPNVPLQLQNSESDCGLAALSMIFHYWGLQDWTPDRIEQSCPVIPDRGVRARDLRACARQAGLECYLVHGSWKDLDQELRRGHPMIVGLVKAYASGPVTHYEVVVGYHSQKRLLITLDPAHGWRQNTVDGFLDEWEATTTLLLVFVGRTGASPPPVKTPG